MYIYIYQSVHSLSHVRPFATSCIAAHQDYLSITNSRSLLKFTSIKSVILSSHLILCRPLLLLPPIPPSIYKKVSSVRSLSHVGLSVTPWIVSRQASLSTTNAWSLLKLMSIELVMPSNHLILSSSSPSALNLSQYQDLSQGVSSLHQVAKVLEVQLQHQSFQCIFRNDFL